MQKGDYATALRLWRPLAEQGGADAQFNVGQMYRRGEGVPQDYAMAMFWFQKAADQGLPTAQNAVGQMYYFGHGVPQDYVQAHMWFNLAAANFPTKESRASAIKNRDTVAAKMTPAQIAEAQKLAREWKPK